MVWTELFACGGDYLGSLFCLSLTARVKRVYGARKKGRGFSAMVTSGSRFGIPWMGYGQRTSEYFR